jgi:hypothetical protein
MDTQCRQNNTNCLSWLHPTVTNQVAQEVGRRLKVSGYFSHHVWVLFCQLVHKRSDHPALATPRSHEVHDHRLVASYQRLKVAPGLDWQEVGTKLVLP